MRFNAQKWRKVRENANRCHMSINLETLSIMNVFRRKVKKDLRS